MLFFRNLKILFVFTFFSCNQSVKENSNAKIEPNTKIENRDVVPKIEAITLIENFKEFRNAIYKRDIVKIKKFIDFPIYNEQNEIWYIENIASKAFLEKLSDKIIPFPETEFDKHVDKIFSKYFVSAILKIKTEILFNKGEYETIELADKDTKYKIIATYSSEKNEIALNLATRSPIKVNDGESNLVEESEYNIIYYFNIENGRYIKFKQIRTAG